MGTTSPIENWIYLLQGLLWLQLLSPTLRSALDEPRGRWVFRIGYALAVAAWVGHVGFQLWTHDLSVLSAASSLVAFLSLLLLGDFAVQSGVFTFRRSAHSAAYSSSLSPAPSVTAAEAANRAKNDFLAVISHEMRTPLSGVMGMLDLLQRLPQSPQQRHYTSLAHDSAETLLDLLDDVLDMAKIEAGRLTLETIPFHIRQELGRAVECMRARAAFKNLSLSCTMSPELPEYLNGDPTRLRQVLTNLLSNAIKFTQHGSIQVNIDCEPTDDRRLKLRIAVSDTGIGMSPQTQARLFKKFEQGDASTTRRFGGTGLGLAIAKHIVEVMQGSISVESRVGDGSVFTFTVVMNVATEADISAARERSSPAALPSHSEQLHVLCAEDEMINRVIVEGLVGEMGHTIEFAEDGASALKKLESGDFDVVLMDNRMPNVDGLQATRMIRDRHSSVRDHEIYIIAATANSSPAHREACFAAGMNRFLTKPFRDSELHAALEAAIKYQRNRGRAFVRASRDEAHPIWQEMPEIPGLSEADILAMIEHPKVANPALPARKVTPKIARQFLVDAPTRLEQIREGLQSSDAAAVGIAAHSIKNISHYVASPRLCALGAEMEAAADANRLEAVAELLPFAEAELQSTRTRLETQLTLGHETSVG